MNAQRKMHEDMGLGAIGKQKIIGVEKYDIRAGRCSKPLDRSPRLPAIVRAADNPHIGITRLDRTQHRAALVGRGIVNDDTFDIWIGLTKDGVDGGTQKTSVIEIDDNDAYQWQAKQFFPVARFAMRNAPRGLHRAAAQTKPIAGSLIQMNVSGSRIEAKVCACPAR